MPSPTMATTLVSLQRFLQIQLCLMEELRPCGVSAQPASLRIPDRLFVVTVSMYTSIPLFCNLSMAAEAVALILSAIASVSTSV